MRPPSVYANPSCPADDPCDLVGLLHGANGLADRPRSGRPRLGSPKLTMRILRLLAQPKAWTIGRLWLRLGRPTMSLRTLHRRVAEVAAWRRPRLVARGDPDRDQILADLHQQLRDLPDGAVVLAEDETHLNLLAWVRSTWIPHGQRQRVMTPGTNRRRTIFGAIDLRTGRFLYPSHPQVRQRQLHRLLRATAGRLPDRATGGGDLRQRHHPPLQDRPALAGGPPRLNPGRTGGRTPWSPTRAR
jgi:hypothetical protein